MGQQLSKTLGKRNRRPTQPLPCTDTVLSVKFEHTSCEEATKGVAELLRDVQRSDALSKLGLVVPR